MKKIDKIIQGQGTVLCALYTSIFLCVAKSISKLVGAGFRDGVLDTKGVTEVNVHFFVRDAEMLHVECDLINNDAELGDIIRSFIEHLAQTSAYSREGWSVVEGTALPLSAKAIDAACLELLKTQADDWEDVCPFEFDGSKRENL